jgi:superfamily I DNA/RNA helicase
MVDPNTNSLLLLYDDAQSIYERKRRNFSFASVGIQAQGRTTVLRLNYRNTAEVLRVAYHFARDYIPPEDGEVPVLQPDSAGRRGDLPVLTQHASVHEELTWIARQLRALTTTGRQWNEMAIVCRYRSIGEQVVKYLRSVEIPVEWLGNANGRKKFKPGENSVKVVTMHSSKGLEFPIVAIPGLGDMPRNDNDATEEAKLLYVAMTRAMERLFMTYHTESKFVRKIRQATLAGAER